MDLPLKKQEGTDNPSNRTNNQWKIWHYVATYVIILSMAYKSQSTGVVYNMEVYILRKKSSGLDTFI